MKIYDTSVWTGKSARDQAITLGVPIVTRVAPSVWVLYPPRPGDAVRGGYFAESTEHIRQITSPICERVWGMVPTIVSAVLTSGMERPADRRVTILTDARI